MFAPAKTASIRCNCAPQNKKAQTFSPARFTRLSAVDLSFDRQFNVDRTLLLAQSAAEFRERNVLQLPDAFARNAELLSDFFQRFGFTAIQAKALKNDFLLPIVEHIKQTPDFIAEIFVPQQFERGLGFLVPDDLAELSGIVVANWRVERRRADRYSLELRNFSARDTNLIAKFIVRW